MRYVQILEACWKGYTQKGMKPKGGKMVPNCVPVSEQELEEDLRKWFKEKWVRFGPDGKIRGDCARGSKSEGKPKCLPQKKAQALGKKGRASAASRKRREDPNPERRGKAKNVATKKKKTTEGMGASAGGGTPGSAGAGGSSLGLPYPSTYEKENNKFKKKGQERTVAMTTEQKIYKRSELPQLNRSHFEKGEFDIKEGKIKLSKLKPIQTERVKGLVEKTVKMIESGKDKPLVIDRKGKIVNGHHRYDAYKQLGYDKVPVLKVNATVEELINKYMK